MMQANPYAAPSSDLAVESDVGFGQPVVFSFKSRAGRLRYITRIGVCMLAGYLVLGLLVGAVLLTSGPESNAAPLGAAVGYMLFAIVSVVFGLMFAIQRLHDLNHTAWLSLLMVVPLANIALAFYILFARGTTGANDYGAPPPPNTLAIKIAGAIFIRRVER